MSDTERSKVYIHLFGGEQDGYRRKIELKTTAPRQFYIWHVNDREEIESAKGKDRMVLQSKLAVMAYELFDEVQVEDGSITVTEYRYRRLESADKVVADPAL